MIVHRPSFPFSWSPRYTLGLTLVSALALAAAAGGASCSADDDNPNGSGGSGAGTGQGGEGGSLFTTGTGGGSQQQALQISPSNPTLDVEYGVAGQTVQFTATNLAGQPVSPVWALNTPEAGTISQTGLFTSNGLAGGEILVVATLGQDSAQTTLSIRLHIGENPGGISPGDQGTLTGGGGQTDAAWNIVYPYNGTVFPRGIPSPEVHFAAGAGSNAYYLKVSMPGCVYEGFFQPTPQIAMSQGAWDALGSCSTGGDATVEISKLWNGQKFGPLTRTWRVAKGKLQGTIYYNTYDSQLAGGTGAMMRIKGNSVGPEVLVGNCTVCHSVSSDGSTAAAANHSGPGGVFDLSSGNVNPPLVWQDSERAAFPALFPKNGEVLVVNGAPGGSWPPNTPGTSGNWTSELRTKTGAIIPASGIESHYAQTPVFSHDGTMLAFTDRPAGGGTGVLALMDYDAATQKFTNYRVLVTPPGGQQVSWPAFTPDNKYVIFQQGVGDDLATWGSNTGKLRAVDVQTSAVSELPMLNGDGYMPAGARDENLNYEPTILPVATGGYFWIMFTSRRTYGNRLTGSRNVTKRLWVSAFDINGGADSSHPAFYIAGQELNSGNSRGFWALDPCKHIGEGCSSGVECCEGLCNPSESDPSVFTCGVPDGSCSNEGEACVTADNCCDPTMECINGHCAAVVPD
ncbi:MAG: PD40 domain-containing protein [Polyangiaceae bacterium]|nr:PD40 domain-containing protein [Polyangiaceae bacterium]